ncbi:MAG TPA: hypothetical protein VM074_08580 [Solimonas sp.]|nr:hypothetical protein [Solimonas sp.]
MRVQWVRGTLGMLLALAAAQVAAQPAVQPVPMGQEYSTPMPIEPQPAPAAQPAPVQAPAPTPAPAPRLVPAQRGAPPPMLSAHPRRRALEAAANGGAGGISYAGPAGAMSTAISGAFCTVTCPDSMEYQVSCPPGFTAFCQCDSEPYAACRQQ